jgi:succinate dehydrogenase / fumarate reductase flavoprotein subunit
VTTSPYEHHDYDVLIIGAGGAGLRAAIEAEQRGLKVGIITKSLLGKAHTVMAEGGIAAAMGNVYSEDNWMVHFRDTMRGGKMLNNYRMAELHAKESPDRVWELEQWGALFDRTKDGKILQRDFGGHRYARLAHVGDRTGLELIRTLQQKVVSMGTDVYMECKVLQLVHDSSGRVAGCVAYWRHNGEFVTFGAKAVIMATGGTGRSWKFTTNSWEGTGDGHAMSLWAGAKLIDMECIQFHPTGMVWPLSVRGLLVTESVRGDGGVLRNSEGKRFMFNYVPEMFRAETADTEEEADKWYDDHSAGRRPPELLPRDEVARAINTEVKAGRGTPHGGVYLDIASRRTPEFIRRRLPSMYHQFMELAGVDITREAMEIGPTCHYIMGGVKVEADTAATDAPGLFAAGECAGGMHGANRLGGNSLSDLIVFGRRAGVGAAEYVESGQATTELDMAEVEYAVKEALGPFDRADGENPYDVQHDLQEMMQSNVGIIRTASEIDDAIVQLDTLSERVKRLSVKGGRAYNPGWNLATDLPAMLTVCKTVALGASNRKESRGGHTREDFPKADPHYGKFNFAHSSDGGKWDSPIITEESPLLEIPDELKALLEEAK